MTDLGPERALNAKRKNHKPQMNVSSNAMRINILLSTNGAAYTTASKQ